MDQQIRDFIDRQPMPQRHTLRRRYASRGLAGLLDLITEMGADLDTASVRIGQLTGHLAPG